MPGNAHSAPASSHPAHPNGSAAAGGTGSAPPAHAGGPATSPNATLSLASSPVSVFQCQNRPGGTQPARAFVYIRLTSAQGIYRVTIDAQGHRQAMHHGLIASGGPSGGTASGHGAADPWGSPLAASVQLSVAPSYTYALAWAPAPSGSSSAAPSPFAVNSLLTAQMEVQMSSQAAGIQAGRMVVPTRLPDIAQVVVRFPGDPPPAGSQMLEAFRIVCDTSFAERQGQDLEARRQQQSVTQLVTQYFQSPPGHPDQVIWPGQRAPFPLNVTVDGIQTRTLGLYPLDSPGADEAAQVNLEQARREFASSMAQVTALSNERRQVAGRLRTLVGSSAFSGEMVQWIGQSPSHAGWAVQFLCSCLAFFTSFLDFTDEPTAAWQLSLSESLTGQGPGPLTAIKQALDAQGQHLEGVHQSGGRPGDGPQDAPRAETELDRAELFLSSLELVSGGVEIWADLLKGRMIRSHENMDFALPWGDLENFLHAIAGVAPADLGRIVRQGPARFSPRNGRQVPSDLQIFQVTDDEVAAVRRLQGLEGIHGGAERVGRCLTGLKLAFSMYGMCTGIAEFWRAAHEGHTDDAVDGGLSVVQSFFDNTGELIEFFSHEGEGAAEAAGEAEADLTTVAGKVKFCAVFGGMVSVVIGSYSLIRGSRILCEQGLTMEAANQLLTAFGSACTVVGAILGATPLGWALSAAGLVVDVVNAAWGYLTEWHTEAVWSHAGGAANRSLEMGYRQLVLSTRFARIPKLLLPKVTFETNLEAGRLVVTAATHLACSQADSWWLEGWGAVVMLRMPAAFQPDWASERILQGDRQASAHRIPYFPECIARPDSANRSRLGSADVFFPMQPVHGSPGTFRAEINLRGGQTRLTPIRWEEGISEGTVYDAIDQTTQDAAMSHASGPAGIRNLPICAEVFSVKVEGGRPDLEELASTVSSGGTPSGLFPSGGVSPCLGIMLQTEFPGGTEVVIPLGQASLGLLPLTR